MTLNYQPLYRIVYAMRPKRLEIVGSVPDEVVDFVKKIASHENADFEFGPGEMLFVADGADYSAVDVTGYDAIVFGGLRKVDTSCRDFIECLGMEITKLGDVFGEPGLKDEIEMVLARHGKHKVVVDFDDLCDDWDPWDELHELKAMFPGLKVTLFAIPSRCSDELIKRYAALGWVELGVHGYHHSSYECAIWDEEESRSKLEESEKIVGNALFKAPGWIGHPELYKVLDEDGWVVADHVDYVGMWGEHKPKRYVFNGQSEVVPVHGHVWDCMGNGPSNWAKMMEFVPKDAEFSFVSEVAR